MSTFQKLGGCIALFGAAKFVLGIAGVLTFLASTGYGTGDVDPELFIAFLADNQAVHSGPTATRKAFIFCTTHERLLLAAASLHPILTRTFALQNLTVIPCSLQNFPCYPKIIPC